MGRWMALFWIAGLSWLGHDYASRPVLNSPGSQPAPFPVAVTSHEAIGVAAPAEPAPLSMEEAGFDSIPSFFHSTRLLADWHQYDQARRITSPWVSLLTEVVDPLFTRADGWHFYNPDAQGGVRESVRRPAAFAIAGGLKFSLSF